MSQSAKLGRIYFSMTQFLSDLSEFRGMEFDYTDWESKEPRLSLLRPDWSFGTANAVNISISISLTPATWMWLLREFKIVTMPYRSVYARESMLLGGQRFLSYYNKELAPVVYDPNQDQKRFWKIRDCSNLIALLAAYDEVAGMTGHLKLFTE